MKNIIYFLGIIIFIGSCSDDDLEICDTSNCITTILCEPDTCFHVSDGTFNTDFTGSDTTYSRIDINPNNDNEYIALRGITHRDQPVPYPTNEIVKYNMETGENTVLLNTLSIIFALKWHKHHGIYFSGGLNSDSKLRKINEDGSGLIQAAPDEVQVTEIEFLEDDKILVQHHNKFFLLDHQGNILQDENVAFGQESPNGQERLFFQNAPNSGRNKVFISIYDEATNTWDNVFSVTESMFTLPIWSSDGAYIYWSDRLGVQRLHLASRKIETVRKNCHNDLFYLQLAIDSQDNLYAIRQIGKVVTTPELNEYFEDRLVRFDINYCEVIDVTPQ